MAAIIPFNISHIFLSNCTQYLETLNLFSRMKNAEAIASYEINLAVVDLVNEISVVKTLL